VNKVSHQEQEERGEKTQKLKNNNIYIHLSIFELWRRFKMANQKNITLSVDEELYDNYRLFCKKKGWLVSRQFEIMMEEQLKGKK
jgi:hypothetical protein